MNNMGYGFAYFHWRLFHWRDGNHVVMLPTCPGCEDTFAQMQEDAT